jgi:hypothetical protein
MLVDCHTHVWQYRRHLSGEFIADLKRAWGDRPDVLEARPESHWSAMHGVDKAIVFGLHAKKAGCVVPNEYVADYANRHPDKVIGFASVDPNRADAARELRRCVRDLGLRGLKLGPTYQQFDPRSERAARVFRLAEELRLPVITHQGATFVRKAPLRYAQPSQLEDVALRFPDLTMVVAHLGHPWEDETAVLIRKQPNLFADISAVHPRPFRLYQKLMTFAEYRVLDKIVFGSDFPFFTPDETIAGLRRVGSLAKDSGLPTLPQTAIDAIVYKNAARAFGSLL